MRTTTFKTRIEELKRRNPSPTKLVKPREPVRTATHAEVRKAFEYDPDTGKLLDSLTKRSAIILEDDMPFPQVRFLKRIYRAQTIIILWMCGVLPPAHHTLIYYDGDPTNLRWRNLSHAKCRLKPIIAPPQVRYDYGKRKWYVDIRAIGYKTVPTMRLNTALRELDTVLQSDWYEICRRQHRAPRPEQTRKEQADARYRNRVERAAYQLHIRKALGLRKTTELEMEPDKDVIGSSPTRS